MLLYSRRFIVWLSAFLVVLLVYLINSRLSRPIPSIEMSGEDASLMVGVDVNGVDPNSAAGMIDGVGVETMRNVRLIKLNKAKEVEREFGFAEVLAKDG